MASRSVGHSKLALSMGLVCLASMLKGWYAVVLSFREMYARAWNEGCHT